MSKWVVCVAMLTFLGSPALADRVDTLSRRLQRSGNYKVRMSAALVLAKERDARAIRALSRALVRDREATIRQVAAGALPPMLSATTPRAVRREATRALRRAARRDRDRKVRRAAEVALGSLQRPPPAKRRSGPLVVSIGRPRGRLPRGSAARVHAAIEDFVRRHAPRHVRTVRSDRLRGDGYSVSSQVAKLSVRRRGSRAEVQCSVSVRIAPYGDGEERWSSGDTATATGSARVQSSTQRRDIDAAANECVLAVLEDVTARRVAPFLAAR